MGILQDLFGGSTSTTTNLPIVGGGTQNQFFQALFGTGIGSNDQGYGVLQGLPGYGGPLSYDINQTLLPGVYGAYSPTTAGTNYATGMLGGGFGIGSSPFAGAQSYYQQFGGQGVPTQNMSLMSQYGGYGAPASTMSDISQFGGPGGAPTTAMGQLMSGGATSALSPYYQQLLQGGGLGGVPQGAINSLMNSGTVGTPAGQGLQSMADTGVAGSWGNPLLATASGQGGPAAGYLSPYADPRMMGATQLAAGGGGAAAAALSPLTASTNLQGLQNMVTGGGNPINVMPAWQSMAQAQARNIQEGQAQLAEQFNTSGNRFSTAYGTASTDYENQAILNQNALLGQMTTQAQTDAQNRLLSAAGSLGGLMGGASGELASGIYGAGNLLTGTGAGTAGQLSGQTYGAGNLLAGYGAGATGQLSSNAIGGANTLFGNQTNALGALNQNTLFGTGQTYQGQLGAANNLFNASNAATMGLYGGQNQMLGNFMNYDLGSQNLGLNTATGLNSMLMGNLGTGMNLGQGQYNIGQSGINNAYSNWWQSLPQNNPLLQYMYGAATGYTGNTQSRSSSGIVPGIGSILGAFNLPSDERLKEDFTKVGEVKGLDLYTYRFKGLPAKQLGFKAQEVFKLYPEAVIPGDEAMPWMIKPGVLLEALARSN